jgi:hypothetical protein
VDFEKRFILYKNSWSLKIEYKKITAIHLNLKKRGGFKSKYISIKRIFEKGRRLVLSDSISNNVKGPTIL